MHIRKFIIAIVLCIPLQGFGQNPLAGAGNCLQFDGIDDFINVTTNGTNNYNLPISVTAWIKIDPTSTGVIPIFSSNDQNSVNAGIHFWLTDTTINAGYSNGLAGSFFQNTKLRQYNSDSIKGIWVHIGAVIKTNGIALYLNGVQLGGQTYNSNINYNTSYVGNTVVGKKTDGNSIAYFKGKMDEVLIWNKALNAVDIRVNMCSKINPVPVDVHRYFKLDDIVGTTILDYSLNSANANAVNNLAVVKSGAALGDASTYIYQTGSWNGYSHIYTSTNQNKITISNVQGNPDGLHMYWVEQIPNTLDTIDWICAQDGYIGIFICRQSTQDYKYNLQFDFSNNNAVNNFIGNPANIALKNRYTNSRYWSTLVASAAANKKFNVPLETTRSEYTLSGLHVAPIVDIPDTVTCADSLVVSVPQNVVYNYLWSNGGTNYITTFRQPGKHWVVYGDSCGNSTVVDSFLVTIGFSSLNIGNDTTLCFGDSLTLNTNLSIANHLWQDGSTNSFYTVTQPGVYWVTATFASCSGTDTVIINYENVVPFNLGIDTTICFRDSIMLEATSSGANTYLWNTGESTPTIWVSKSGNYSVIAGSSSCLETDDINIEVNLENIQFAQDTLICKNQVAILWASGGTDYTWNTGETNDTIIVSPNTTNTYTVIISENGCSEEVNIIVTVTNKIAIADFDYIVNACSGSVEFYNKSTNADIYFWDFGDNQFSTDENPVHFYNESGFYTVSLVASRNSCPDTLSQSIQLIKLKDIIYFPSAFTPNQDGLNDLYEIKGSADCFINPNLIIYNRWGQEVFNSSDPFIEFWDGYFKGKRVIEGIYFYSFYSSNYNIKGKLTLIH